ncbi:MAG: QueG-associated DUF1730 domain-containing protein [Acholeplasmataceae bacterium]
MIYQKLNKVFDFVGVINKEKYTNYHNHELMKDYRSIFVVGLAYPNEYLPQKKDSFVASMYTYGYDYHDVIKGIINEALKDENDYLALVDNHEINERKCLELTGLAYHAKNNLMIHKDFGSYFFIGLVLTKTKHKEVITTNTDSCGDCDLCIRACPVSALTGGFDVSKCMSARNQSKRSLPLDVMNNNYLLLGCDICQRVCPKNKGISSESVSDLKIKPTAYVLIDDLFNLSNKEFKNKYGKHAYTWRGKTLLLRNAITLLLRQKNTDYNEAIKKTLSDNKYPSWYKEDTNKMLKKLESFNL